MSDNNASDKAGSVSCWMFPPIVGTETEVRKVAALAAGSAAVGHGQGLAGVADLPDEN